MSDQPSGVAAIPRHDPPPPDYDRGPRLTTKQLERLSDDARGHYQSLHSLIGFYFHPEECALCQQIADVAP